MYEIRVSWVTDIFDVVMVNATTYTVIVRPLNINEPGAELETKQVGFYIRDFVGNTYEITEINVGGNPRRVKVVDTMNVGLGPQSGQQAYVYESVQEGDGPIIGPVRHDRLDRSSKETSAATEQEVAWKHRGVREETNNIDNITTFLLGDGLAATFEIGTGWKGGNKMTLNSAGTVTADNGLTKTLENIQLGGDLINSQTVIGNVPFDSYGDSLRTIFQKSSLGNSIFNKVSHALTLQDTGLKVECGIEASGTTSHQASLFSQIECNDAASNYANIIQWAKVLTDMNDIVSDVSISNSTILNSNLAVISQSVGATYADVSIEVCVGSDDLIIRTPSVYSGYNDRVLPISVNGGYADSAGNISVMIGASIGDWIDDLPFQYKDIEAGTVQVYVLDPCASYTYVIESLNMDCDNGTLEGIFIRIGTTSITSLSDVDATVTNTTTLATGANSVAIGNRVELVTSIGFTGMPTQLVGKINKRRT